MRENLLKQAIEDTFTETGRGILEAEVVNALEKYYVVLVKNPHDEHARECIAVLSTLLDATAIDDVDGAKAT